ncbi:MAG: hypothetical protein KGJ69_02605, partial [Thermoplasmata archaeon]|nr:hypothetical protein [Thermoplasmata archaeon]
MGARLVLGVLLGVALVALVASGAQGESAARLAASPHEASLPAAAPPGSLGASPSSLGSFSTPYGSFNLPQGGCTTGLNGTCPHLTPSIS